MLQKANRPHRADNDEVWVDFQKPFYAAGVVRFGMVDDEVMNPLHIDDIGNILQKVSQEADFSGLHQGGFLAALDDIRVIGRAELRHHDDVEDTEVGVLDATPIKVFFQLFWFHFLFPF
ncbi:MAG: hypothetical protein NTV44_03515 [Firmicutes bacterium]|nr:hypothetical protein [Bacillota bacterium]